MKNKTVLEGKRCYLSGPIDYCNDLYWREGPKKVLTEEFGIDLFDPFADPKQMWHEELKVAQEAMDYDEMARIAKGFVRKDLAMVDHSHFVIAYLPYKLPTTGTHAEIINSIERKKPTLLVCPQGKNRLPLWYYGIVPHQVMFGSWEDLYHYLREVNDGKHRDNHRWWITYEMV